MIAESHYQVPWRARGGHPGRHAGTQSGGGFELQAYAPFASQPDPRNLDVRATLADPFGQLMVRNYRQQACIPVYLVADLSASMSFRGKASKLRLLAEFAESLAWSAWRTGDPFGFFGCDGGIRWDLSLPLRRRKGMAATWCKRIEEFQPESGRHGGLWEAAAQLGRQRALVFLASDFHLDGEEMKALLDAFAFHDLVPVVLWDSGEYEHLPRWGLADLQDPETGERRRLFLRPSLREKLKQRFGERREEIVQRCAPRGREPFFLIDRFDADAMTRYFYPA